MFVLLVVLLCLEWLEWEKYVSQSYIPSSKRHPSSIFLSNYFEWILVVYRTTNGRSMDGSHFAYMGF